MKLIIFDMDQTLVDFLSVHDEATLKVFRKFFDIDARLTEVDYSGKSLNENFRVLAGLKRIPQEEFLEKSPLLLEAYESAFAESLPREPGKYILPGVLGLLKELSKTDHVVVLYTGDSPGIVRCVLSATCLGRYFRFCFFGTEVATRDDMVRQALKKASALTGRKFTGKSIVIIGDSVRDVACGKIFGALTIAIATGFHAMDQLSQTGPDYVFKDLSDYRKVMEIIQGK